MNEIVLETPTGPETYPTGDNAVKAYEMMLSLICFMAVDAGVEYSEWQADLDDLCDAAVLAPDDLEAEFVRASWNDWSRDFLTYGETQVRFDPGEGQLRQVAGKGKRGVMGSYQLHLETSDQSQVQDVYPALRKLTQNATPVKAQQRPGVGRTIWMYPWNQYRIFYVVDEPSNSVIVIDISRVLSVKLKAAALGERRNVTYADREEPSLG